MSQAIEDLTERCSRCHAEPGVPCTNPETGKPAKIPCVARLRKVSA